MNVKLVLTFLIASMVTWIARSYLDSYFKTKGANLATKEDIKEITQIVEDVKSEVSVNLELTKWQLGKKATVHRIAAEKEFEALAEIGRTLYEMQSATMNLRPAMDRHPKDEPAMERHNRRYQTWMTSFAAFRDAIEKPKLFLPSYLYSQFFAILRLASKEGTGFEISVRHAGPVGQLDFKAYEQAEKNVEEMNNAIDAAISAIRKRYDIDD